MKEIIMNKMFGGFLLFVFVISYSSTAHDVKIQQDKIEDNIHENLVYNY